MKDPFLYLIHIQQALEDIQDFTAEGRDSFLRDRKTQNAVVRSFEVIGEAAKRLPTDTRDATTQIPWRRLAGFRDILIHAYDRVDWQEVWNIVEKEVPRLLQQIRTLCEEHEGHQA